MSGSCNKNSYKLKFNPKTDLLDSCFYILQLLGLDSKRLYILRGLKLSLLLDNIY